MSTQPVVPCCEHCRHPLLRMVHRSPCLGCRDASAARDAARVRNETRDRLDALDDAATETVLARLLTDAPDLTRQLLAAAADLDVDAVRDALNETGNPA